MNVDQYVETHVLAQYRDVAAALRALLRDCAPSAHEAFSYNMPVWVGRRIVAYMNGSQKGITFSFVYGTELRDDFGLLKGVGKTARYVKLKSVEQLATREAALRDYVAQALEIDARPPAQSGQG